jgi:hypothetical protein
MSNLRARPIARVAIAMLSSLALVFVMIATTETPADARRVRHKRSPPAAFVGPSDFKCYWVKSTAQYFCQETHTRHDSPPIGFALEAADPANPDDVGLHTDGDAPPEINPKDFVTPKTFSCSLTGSDARDPADYNCTYGKNPCFTLAKAMAIIEDEETEDGKTKEVFIDTWFMPRQKNC